MTYIILLKELLIFFLLLLLFFKHLGCSVSNENCNTNPALICLDETFQVKFPENEEEALNLCK